MQKPELSVQFISKLVQLTTEGELEWRLGTVNALTSPDSRTSSYETDIDGQRLRIYRVTRPMTDVSSGGYLGPSGPSGPTTRGVVVPALDIMDDFGRVKYTFEGIAGLRDLYEAASFSSSKVRDLMELVLRRK